MTEPRVSRAFLRLFEGGIVVLTTLAVTKVVNTTQPEGGFYQARCGSTFTQPCNLTRNFYCNPNFRQCLCAPHPDPQFIYTYDSATRGCVESLSSDLTAYQNCKFVISNRSTSGAEREHDCKSHLDCEELLGQHGRCNLEKCACECGQGQLDPEAGQLELQNGKCVPVPQVRALKCETDAHCKSEGANGYGVHGVCDQKRRECTCSEGTQLQVQSGRCIPLQRLQVPNVQMGKGGQGLKNDLAALVERNAVAGAMLATLLLPMLALCCVSVASFACSRRRTYSESEQSAPIPLEEMTGNIPHVKKSAFTIDRKRILGRGKCGIVYQGKFGNRIVAVKTTNPECRRVDMYMDALDQEIEIFKFLPQQQHIIKLYAYCLVGSAQCFMLMELCSNGSLRTFLTRRNFLESASSRQDVVQAPGSYSLRDLFNFAQQIAVAAEFLAQHRVVHGDIACRNVLLDSNLVVKLTDFGLGRRLGESQTYIKTTDEIRPWKWSAPEVLSRNEFSTQSNVWSFGVTLWEIFALGAEPYCGLEYCQTFPRDLYQGFYLLPRPNMASIELYRLMKKCWQSEPVNRITFRELRAELEALMYVDTPPTYEELQIDMGIDGYLVSI